MTINLDELDLEPYREKIVKIAEGFRYEEPHPIYVKDIKKLLKIIDKLIFEREKAKRMVKGAHEANDKMQNKKYKMISLLTTIDSCLPEPTDPNSLPEDYRFEVSLPWGLIKTIRNVIKGT